ncbi:MAG: hypothetical protein JW995_09830 [Melioribacteraceae bacterium]|nr:hypothetical protein [Melioribacteraceae bacterium]
MQQAFRIFLVITVFLSINAFSQNVDEYELFQLKALKGIKSFGIYVWDIDGYHKDSTLTVRDVESYLYNAIKPLKVKTLSFSEARKLEGQPNLEAQIKVDQKKSEDDYVYSVILRFVQDVRMERNKQPHYSGIVWERDELGHAQLKYLNLEIKIALNSLVDEFIEDYTRVN